MDITDDNTSGTVSSSSQSVYTDLVKTHITASTNLLPNASSFETVLGDETISVKKGSNLAIDESGIDK
ncbi:hypothetical protein OZX61_02335 [Acinetobacter sp. ESL0695]|uniref:hypothetical protein n=1 Tax=Acinetobacter sp. ESL0695 TaxID=2983215 RepID=UPI0023F1E6AE|nr:hypothetical protein [Acinetobacter sp. ESL0695]WEV49347.1 hypothetical protein OZX61_02335 [Acinetobacter sp. ESL0695]